MPPTLILLGGLPATGKSTVAAELIRQSHLAYLRVDTIEQALRDAGELGDQGLAISGYVVGYAVARDLLAGGVDVLVECVNPFEITRQAWRDVATAVGATLVEVELFCSDAKAHRERAETRTVDIEGLPLPDWDAIQDREYHPWSSADLRIDTAVTSPREAAARIRATVLAASSPENPR